MARIAASSCVVMLLTGCVMPGDRGPLADRVIPCPCEVGDLGDLHVEHPAVVIDRDSDFSTKRYHPGAFVVYRVYDPETDPIAGNQCAFDADGRLIPDGPAAGTPDFVSPERSVLGHFVADVLPFHRLGWMEYHRRGWGPVSRAICD